VKATIKKMKLNKKQLKVKKTIETVAELFSIDPTWAAAIAMTESSLGLFQKSGTGCRGVFQMSEIAMIDLLWEMETVSDELVDTVCGVAFLSLLLKRHGTIQGATAHYCDPNDLDFYIDRVLNYMNELK